MDSRGAPESRLLLKVEHLSVRFGRHVVLRDVTFCVPRGGSLAVIGPNGAGKTLLFRALIGSVAHEGRVAWAPGTRLGYVPQQLDLRRDLPITGDDFLRARASVLRAAAAQVRDACAFVGLSAELTANPIGRLSGGQFQRVLVAAALIGAPDAVLLDEPTAGVDEPGFEQLNAALRRLRRERGLAILLISHEFEEVAGVADRVLCLGREGMCAGVAEERVTPALLTSVLRGPGGYHLHDAPRH